MSRIFTVRFACLVAVSSLAAVTTLTLAAAAGAKPAIPAPANAIYEKASDNPVNAIV